MASFKFLLSSLLVVLSFISSCLCGEFNYYLPRCSTSGCYGYDDTWTLTTETKSEGIEFIAINGKWPPTPVEIKIGQRLRIKVVNNLAEDVTVSISMHEISETA